MKSIFLKSVLLIITCNQINAQQTSGLTNSAGLPETLNYNKITSGTSGKTLNYGDIEGSPYFKIEYESASVDGFQEVVLARYNMFTDEKEFKKNGTILSLPKSNDYKKIKFNTTQKTLMWIDGNLDDKGYYFVLQDGKNKLLRKNKVRFVDETEATSSYSISKPATFKILPVDYFVLSTSNELASIKNLKEFANRFPKEKESINSFVKANKIKADKEGDLLKLINYLNEFQD